MASFSLWTCFVKKYWMTCPTSNGRNTVNPKLINTVWKGASELLPRNKYNSAGVINKPIKLPTEALNSAAGSLPVALLTRTTLDEMVVGTHPMIMIPSRRLIYEWIRQDSEYLQLKLWTWQMNLTRISCWRFVKFIVLLVKRKIRMYITWIIEFLHWYQMTE